MKAPFKKGDTVIGVNNGHGDNWFPQFPRIVHRIRKDKVYFSGDDKTDWCYWNGEINDAPGKIYIKKVDSK
jgi:hypothetical protein